ncbi:FAD-binding oxidoreductase [Persicimonas caeni]|uniref:FAD-binding oxidoreductase n=1 Tax=Persicimonas caeni TaxID=2292766 RepID=A0A4Y6PX11_PERCE|nr:FAD-binding oxidoreductase [Persicimonas caeni]QDG52846.1 FAD-binding oxidoreductase [Persicimonas caeni]QED34068.1 FAD-binding oxidoreductase [Persicimonas caeni]
MSKREQSFWGWGYADKFPDDEGRKNLGSQVTAMLGFDEVELLEPPSLDDVELRPPRVEPPEALAAICSTDKRERTTHTYGKAYRDIVRGFRADFGEPPDFVAYPTSADDVRRVLDWASDEEVAVVPFGGGTSVVGGVETDVTNGASGSFRGVVSLDMRCMDRVLEVDKTSRAARIQAGATGPRLAEQLHEHDLSFRHYPQSYEFSTFGGWIATRAGGHYATRYTHIDDFIESVQMIAPAGEFQTRRLPASGAGPSPDALALGSEGALGVITEAWTRVHLRPRFRSKASVHFAEFEDAVRATREVVQSGLAPANLRLLDSREAMLNGVVFDGSNVLLVAFESPRVPTEPDLERALEICREFDGKLAGEPVHVDEHDKSPDSEAGGRWRSSFFEGPYLQNTMVSLGVIADTFETACTWDRFDTLHRRIITDVRDAMKRVCGAGFISCRFTHVYPDGPAPYYTFLAPAKVGSELEQWDEIKSAAAEAIADVGATITHHHAVGRTHKPWYKREVPELFQRGLQQVKESFDPKGVLNPGVLL